jgi:hypothetical protein
MQTTTHFITGFFKSLVLFLVLGFSSSALSQTLIVDDFGDQQNNNLGFPRIFISDASSGGKTQFSSTIEEGVIHIKGEIEPPRGQPGWASSTLPLSAMGQIKDASGFTGIKLRVNLKQGNLSVSANSAEIGNFDYHAAPVIVRADGQFHELKIPFSSLKRAWSEQTTLNTETLISLSIVAFDLKKGAFDFQLDEIGFY